MTAPAPPTSSSTAPPPQEGSPALTAAALAVVAALALYLAATLTAGVVVATVAIPTWLIKQILSLGGIDAPALRTALRIARSQPLPRIPHRRVAERAVARGESVNRARYVIAAARRITTATRLVGDDRASVRRMLATERRYFRQHMAAAAKRRKAARQVDRVAAEAGTRLLVWRAVMDDRTTSDCAALNGTVFDIGKPPGGTYPGGRHVHCRCTAGPA